MRRRIVLLVAVTTSAVVAGFLIPLCLLVRNVAEDRAVASAKDQAQLVAGLLASVPDAETLTRATSTLTATGPGVIVIRANESVVGATTLAPDTRASVERARRDRAAFTVHADHGLDAIVPVVTPTGLDIVVASVPEDEVRQGVAQAWLAIGGLGLGLIVGAVLVARTLGERVSTPVADVAAVAHRIREGDLAARAEVTGPPEAAEVAAALNALAERIESLLEAERDRVADLGHRLRTPVTALRLDADLVADTDVAQRLRSHIDELQRGVDRVVRDARRAVRDPLPVTTDAVAVVRERVAFWTALAEDQGRRVTPVAGDPSTRMPSAAFVPMAPEDLAEIVDCLLDNVFAHTPEGTGLAAGVLDDASRVRLVVEDGGPGAEAIVVDRGRSGSGSTGIGLDIVRRSVEAVGGEVVLDRSSLGGLRVTVNLPRVEARTVAEHD